MRSVWRDCTQAVTCGLVRGRETAEHNRRTHQCDAVAIVREHLPTFLERVGTCDSTLPNFVRRELEAFITCGDFEQGFLVAKCRWCGDVVRVPFCYKSRAELLAFVCQRFASFVMQSLRRIAKRQHHLASSRNLHPGVLIVVQRFKNDLGLVVLDHRGDDDVPFAPLRTLESTALTAVLQRLHRDLERRHRGEDADVDPAIASCVALGRRSPAPVAPDDHEAPPRPLCVRAFGMQLHGAAFASMSRATGRTRARGPGSYAWPPGGASMRPTL